MLLQEPNLPLKVLRRGPRVLTEISLVKKPKIPKRNETNLTIQQSLSHLQEKLLYIAHLFLQCNFYGSLWCSVTYWFGFDSVSPNTIEDQLLQFEYLASSSKSRRSTMMLIWLACLWVI